MDEVHTPDGSRYWYARSGRRVHVVAPHWDQLDQIDAGLKELFIDAARAGEIVVGIDYNGALVGSGTTW